MNVLINKSTLVVSAINRQPQLNEFEVVGVSDLQKEIAVPVKVQKLDIDEKPLFLLPQQDKEIPVPTPKTIETTEETSEDGTPNTPIMEKKTRQVALLDSNGQQIKYYPQTTRYEQQEIGVDAEGNKIYESVEVVTVSDTPILCFTTEEYEEQKVDSNNNPLFTTEIMEDVISYEPVNPLEITSEHPEWTEDLEPIIVDAEEPKVVKLSEAPEFFSYEEIEPSLSTLKQIRLSELYDEYQVEKNGQVISTLLGTDGLNIIFPYGEKNQNDYRSIGITFALDDTQTESIIGSDSHGKFYINREDFLTLTKEFQDFEVGLYMKMKQKETEVLADTCNTVELIKAIVW